MIVFHQFCNEIILIKKLMEKDWICTLEHTLREANQSADVLTKMGAMMANPLVIVHEAPQLLKPKLHTDALGVLFPRGF